MARAYMPFYVGDFLADTMHLGATERGIYISLIVHNWQHGSIPRDKRKLARIAACDSRLWHQYEATVLQFFDVVDASTMQHKRVATELRRYAEKHNNISDAATTREAQRRSNRATTVDNQLHNHLHSSTTSNSEKPSPLNAGDQKVSCETSEEVAEVTKPPRHGARSRDGRFVYFKRGSSEFEAYAKDYQEGTGDEPIATADGRWFKLHGEVVSKIIGLRQVGVA